MHAAKFLLLLLALLSPGVAVPSTSAASAGGGSSDGLYKTLGLSRDCSQKDIKKAYRRLSLRHHPDKVPESERAASEEKFKKIGRAYECLSDEKKRELYDRYGEAALDPNFNPAFAGTGGHGGGGGPQPFPFSSSEFRTDGGGGGMGGFSFEDAASMFGGMGGGGGMGGPGGFGGFNIDLSHIFENMMRGQHGHGRGVGPNSPRGFSGFGGGGGPSFGQQHGPAGGAGMGRAQKRAYVRPFHCSLEDLADSSGCTKKLKVKNPMTDPMTGETVKMERIYTVHVKPGWKAGTKVKFPAKDGFPPITFVLKEKPHAYLKRDGDDLLWRCVISERQAERGAKLSIPLPDGENLTLSTRNQVPTRDGDRMTIAGKGMPIKGGPERGDLVIEFRISSGRGDKQ